MTVHIISSLFIIESLLISLIFLYLLLNKGFTFKGGIAFGVLYFIFIPIWVLIITGKIPIDQTNFSRTTLTDVILKTNIKSSFILLLYLFAIIIYLYISTITDKRKILDTDFKLNLKLYLPVYVVSLLIIFIGSGLLEGGNWYDNRNTFFKETGSIAILIGYILTASRILIIASLIYLWKINKLKTVRFFIYILSFSILDMFLSGNRLYFFITIVMIGLLVLKRYPVKTFIMLPLTVPLVAFVAYFGSIFRHMRGPLFEFGLPTRKVFMASLKRAMSLEPFDFSTFFLNISESVNVNVIYDIFNRYDHILYGATYLKTLFFYIPRSIWQSKPESITVITANQFGSASLVTTIIGEMQMNFSYFGIVLLPIFLWLTEIIIKKFSPNNYFYSIITFIFGLLIFRMPYSDEMIVFFFIVLLLYVSKIKWKIVIKNEIE